MQTPFIPDAGQPATPATLDALLRGAQSRLEAVGIPDARVDAELLLAHLEEMGRGELQAAIITGRAARQGTAEALDALLGRREAREPLQHILGSAPFRSLELLVGPGVFVPRPETELVVQYAIDALNLLPEEEPIAVDLGTGSGAIALAMATEVPRARVYALEKIPAAHAWAARNFAAIGAPNASLHLGDMAEAFPELDGRVAVLISNPPYVPARAIPRDPEVRLFDPPTALYGGEDGLDLVRALSARGLGLLRPGGTLIIEHGELQGEAIRGILTADGWGAAATFRDLTQRDRVTTALR
ncbi:peptide chain release factor N(5)-glutamine methyltransferase [Mycetocola spongiae]|uniref:peptide chain release factor N(5)-glutamine methyltransferase n=1 Tax=Mycetocola spongiae TaxID=2859226 RepID=UPI001CF47ADE|nr:peptide chain release factor N(5)-glutamine methyltransferase [Mycetocola spongiae]UCR90149.1 peptide chain release factor N(5)-glutamine methyltransferase [Mycetocola spongiae]